MAEFIDLQADVNTTNSEFEEEVNYEKDEISSLIDDLFVDDNDQCFYYQLQNEIKTADEAINDFLINDETVSDEIPNYCQEWMMRIRLTIFYIQKIKLRLLKRTFLTLKILQKICYFMQFFMP